MADDEPQGDPDLELEQVFETTDPTLLPVLKSVLESAGIPYYLEGEESLGLLPLQGGFLSEDQEPLAVEIHVAADRAEEARALLASAAEGLPEGAAEETDEESETLPPEST
ncbi:MAG: putative signal transducing protein [Thermoanaerobaculia bacterium]